MGNLDAELGFTRTGRSLAEAARTRAAVAVASGELVLAQGQVAVEGINGQPIAYETPAPVVSETQIAAHWSLPTRQQ